MKEGTLFHFFNYLDTVYFTDWRTRAIMKMSKTRTSTRVAIKTRLDRLYMVKMWDKSLQPTTSKNLCI